MTETPNPDQEQKHRRREAVRRFRHMVATYGLGSDQAEAVLLEHAEDTGFREAVEGIVLLAKLQMQDSGDPAVEKVRGLLRELFHGPSTREGRLNRG